MPKNSFRFEVTGIDKAIKRLHQVGKQATSQTLDAVLDEMEDVLKVAQANVPVKTGALRDSGKLQVRRSNSAVEGVVTFGSDSVDYAASVHELHPTKSKYLSRALTERMKGMLRRVAAKVRLK